MVSVFIALLLLLLSRFSCVRLCAAPWTAAYQAPLSMGFSRQEYWSGSTFPGLGDQVGLSRLSKVMFQKPRYTP